MPVDQTEEWFVDIANMIAGCQDIGELMRHATGFMTLKFMPRLTELIVPAFQAKASRLLPRKSRVVAVDLNGFFWQSFGADPGNANTLTQSRLRALYKDLKPEKFIIAKDGADLERRKAYPEYKKNRPLLPANFVSQLKDLTEYLVSKGIQVESHVGHEADDILASVAYRCMLLGLDCVLVSEDKDIWQCMSQTTKIYAPKAREHRDREWLLKTHDITPSHVVDWLCLVGKNDVPSVYGIGDKLASELLVAYQSFVGIMDSLDKLTEKKQQAFRNFGYTNYWLSSALHELNRRIDVCVW